MSEKHSLQQVFEKAKQLHQLKQLDEAEQSYREVLARHPSLSEAHHLLGILLSQKGDHKQGIQCLLKAIEGQPAQPNYYHNLGKIYAAARQWDSAIQTYQIATKLAPKFHEAWFNLANAYKAQGQWNKSEQSYKRTLKINPQYAPAWYNLGNGYQEIGRMKTALDAYEKCLNIQPKHALAHNNIATVLEHWDESEKALLHYQKALELQADSPEALKNLAAAHEKQGNTQIAKEYYESLLTKTDHPSNAWTRWQLGQLSEIIWPDSSSIRQYRDVLFQAIERSFKDPPKLVLSELSKLSIQPPFDLAYQGINDFELKKSYGRFFDQYFKHLRLQIHNGSQRNLRTNNRHVGIVVTSGHEGVFIKCMRGIMNHLDTSMLGITIVCNRPNGEEILRPAIHNKGVRFLSISPKLDIAIRQVEQAQFDILYYWEVGTDALNYFLPFCQLAPIQCTSWGWPVTSGIPSVDYFISCGLLETEAGKTHYTEELILFNNLPTYYYRPSIPAKVNEMNYYNLPEGKNVYLCAQNLRKIHPDMDALFKGILEKDPYGILVLIHDKRKNISGKLEKRLRNSCSAVFDQIHFVARMSESDYLNLVVISDVILDTLYYTGGANTASDAIAAGTPYVTLPSEYHRGRYGAAAYRQLGITELIANTQDDYIAKSVQVASDPSYRSSLRQRLLERSASIFEDLEAVRELEHFFKTISIRNHDKPATAI